MTTLYRPNHRLKGPIESNKHLTGGTILWDGISGIKAKLDEAFAVWDKSSQDMMQGDPGLVTSRAKILDWHGSSGSFLSRARDAFTGEKRVDVVPATSIQDVQVNAPTCDAVAIGVGSIPSLDSSTISQIKSMIGKTRLIVGRLILPYLEELWDALGVFETFEKGEPGILIQEGWSPALSHIEDPVANSQIPDDELAADNAPVINGSGAHRFYIALSRKTMILGLGIGILPQDATDAELQWTYEAIQQWLSPSFTSMKPIWTPH